MRMWITGFGLLVGVATSGCTKKDGTETDTSAADVGLFECDPVGAFVEMGALLNAELAPDVEVILKVPQHPGAPGPEDLP
jgi:hypothetical protein